jgi:hypothetical protein
MKSYVLGAGFFCVSLALRHVTRNIKRWRDGDVRRRWIGLGLLRAAERFRRIKRHDELPYLVRALRPDTSAVVAA